MNNTQQEYISCLTIFSSSQLLFIASSPLFALSWLYGIELVIIFTYAFSPVSKVSFTGSQDSIRICLSSAPICCMSQVDSFVSTTLDQLLVLYSVYASSLVSFNIEVYLLIYAGIN